MAHKTLIGGTAYEIGGGKTLIGGTAYSIDKGKTLVGGTAYEVGFGPAMCKVTLLYDDTNCAEIYVDGYGTISSIGTYEFPVGTVLSCWTDDYDSPGPGNGVHVNGPYSIGNEYDYTLTGDIDIYMDGTYLGYDEGRIYIFERSNGYIGFSVTINAAVHYHGAMEGMTWGEWVTSEHNTANYPYFEIGDNGRIYKGLGYLVDDSGNPVFSTDQIIARHSYSIKST